MDQKGRNAVLVIILGGLFYEGLALVYGWQLLSDGVWTIDEIFPPFKFLFGILCGHFFWPRIIKEKK